MHRIAPFAFAALVLATASPSAFAQPVEAAVITIKNFDFSPMTVTIPAGGEVTWINRDGEPHTVTSVDGAFRSGAIDQDERFSFRFAKPGTYQYVCSIHPQMRASVVVK